MAGVPGRYGFNDGTDEDALFDSPMGIAVSPDGSRVFVADSGNHLIRIIENGRVFTLAGTRSVDPAAAAGDEWEQSPMGGFADGRQAMFNGPAGLALWGEAVIVADRGNNRIRAVWPNGEVVTLAGTGVPGHIDGLPAQAAFHLPMGVYVRGEYLFIADAGNNMIRKMTLGG